MKKTKAQVQREKKRQAFNDSVRQKESPQLAGAQIVGGQPVMRHQYTPGPMVTPQYVSQRDDLGNVTVNVVNGQLRLEVLAVQFAATAYASIMDADDFNTMTDEDEPVIIEAVNSFAVRAAGDLLQRCHDHEFGRRHEPPTHEPDETTDLICDTCAEPYAADQFDPPLDVERECPRCDVGKLAAYEQPTPEGEDQVSPGGIIVG